MQPIDILTMQSDKESEQAPSSDDDICARCDMYGSEECASVPCDMIKRKFGWNG